MQPTCSTCSDNNGMSANNSILVINRAQNPLGM